MTTLEAINKIKQMFAEAGELPMASVEPTQSFAEYSLKSGAKVMIDKLEVGGKVSLIDEGGNESPAPAGEHELIDGSVIVLDEVEVSKGTSIINDSITHHITLLRACDYTAVALESLASSAPARPE